MSLMLSVVYDVKWMWPAWMSFVSRRSAYGSRVRFSEI